MGSVVLALANSWPFNGLYLRGNRQGLLLTTGRKSYFGVYIFILVVGGHSTTRGTKFGTIVFCFQNCSDLLLEKNVLLIKKIFWNLKLKAENMQNFWDHKNNLFEQWKVKNNFWNRILFNLFLEVSQIVYVRTIIFQIGKNN